MSTTYSTTTCGFTLSGGEYVFHRFPNPLGIAPSKTNEMSNKDFANFVHETSYDIFLSDDEKRLTTANGGRRNKPSGVSFFIPWNNDKAFAYAHDKLKIADSHCCVSTHPTKPHENQMALHDRNIPLSQENRQIIAAHITLHPTEVVPVEYLEDIALCKNRDANWKLCTMATRGKDVDLPDFEDDPHLHLLVLILERFIKNTNIDANLRFEAAIYQYVAAEKGKYFDDTSGASSICQCDERFHYILKLALKDFEIKIGDPSLLLDIRDDNELCTKLQTKNLLSYSDTRLRDIPM